MKVGISGLLRRRRDERHLFLTPFPPTAPYSVRTQWECGHLQAWKPGPHQEPDLPAPDSDFRAFRIVRNKCLLFKLPFSGICCIRLSRLRQWLLQSRWENEGTELTQPMESEPRQELGLLDLQTADSTHQAPPPFTQQCVWKEILFYHWIVWEKTNRFYV